MLLKHAISLYAAVAAKLLQSCPNLSNPMDCSPPVSSVHGILQARILEWIAISFSRGSSQPRDQTHVSYTGEVYFILLQRIKIFFTTES